MDAPTQKPGQVFRRRNVIRFAGEAFGHANLAAADDGPTARKVTSTIAWKQPPSTSVAVDQF